MTTTAIIRLLPYAEPFRFVDELERVDENGATGYYTFRPEAGLLPGALSGSSRDAGGYPDRNNGTDRIGLSGHLPLTGSPTGGTTPRDCFFLPIRGLLLTRLPRRARQK
jgi:hypothetical protein